MTGENLSSDRQPDPRALALAAQLFPPAAYQAEKRGIHTFIDVEDTNGPFDGGLYIFDDINNRLIYVIRRQDGSAASLGRTLPPPVEGGLL